MKNPTPFPDLFPSFPPAVNGVLKSILRVNALEEIYAEARIRNGDSLTRSVLEVLNVRVDISTRDLDCIPKSGPVVIVANHPFGLLDGAVLDSVLAGCRPDIKILTNQFLCGMEEVAGRFIPVDVFAQPAAEVNLRTVRSVLGCLSKGHGIAMFPAGEVSHWTPDQRAITDPPWNTFAARCARHADAPVIPVFFVGWNSVTFHLAGLLHPRLRTFRLPSELLNKRDSLISVRIGRPIPPRELAKFESDVAATQYLRARVYMLNHRRPVLAQGRRFSHTSLSKIFPRAPVAEETAGLASEIELLSARGCRILDTATYEVYVQTGDRIPLLLREIGRLRELTFREVAEGSGKTLDLDSFDSSYTHVILWHKERACIAGAYRLTWTDDILGHQGVDGLYTSTLFRYAPGFFERLGPAVELGRSFIRREFQRDYAPLLLLWQAIARCVACRPSSPVLFGAVSISASYSEASRNMIVQFLSGNCFREDLAELVQPRTPFRSRLTRQADLKVVSECLHDVDELPIGDIEDCDGVPILLRQYLRLGGRVAAFNVDRKFSNALDALLIVDLRDTQPKLLSKYMGAELSSEFLRGHASRGDYLPVPKI